jgi:redox-sensing transcriptional repressor
MSEKIIPNIVIGRLPIYLRTLEQMFREGRQVTASQELGGKLGISAAQIRKDLSQFGEFGKQGTGYDIEFLSKKIREILHVDRVWDVVIIGAGELGHALARYQGFSERGFQVKMIFDNNPNIIGQQIKDFTVKGTADLVEEIKQAGVKVAMIATPASSAQEVANLLIEAGVKVILNYAPTMISVPRGVRVRHIDPTIYLQWMTYYLE